MTEDEALPEKLPPPDAGVLALARLYIPGQIPAIHDADGTPNANRVGVNRSMCTSNANGLLVDVDPYLNAEEGDNIRIFSSLDPIELLSFNLAAGQENEKSHVFLPGNLLKQGHQVFHYEVTRGSENLGSSVPLQVFIRFMMPGGSDPQPDRPGHYRLLAPRLLNVPARGITRELAESQEGVQFAIPAYPNMRQFDVHTLSFGGKQFDLTVSLDQVGKDIVGKIPLDTVIDAGNGEHIFIYRPLDEVHNRASDWSLRKTVYSEVTPDLLRPVILDEVQVESDTGDLFYDLTTLGRKNVQADVITRPVTFEIGDSVRLWVSTIADGVETEVFSETKEVTQIDSTVRFFVDNATVVQQLASEYIYFRYELTSKRTGIKRRSSRTTVKLIGNAVNLPAPKVLPINGVVVDPAKAATGIVSPHAGIVAQAWVHFHASGTAPGGVQHLYDSGRRISSSQASRDMTFPLAVPYLAKIDGGPLEVYYTVGTSKDDPLAAQSLRHSVRVGQPKPDLKAVDVVDAVDGVIDPDLLPPFADAELQVPPFINMKGHTAYLWYQSDNPLDSQRYEDSIDIDDRDLDIPVSFYLTQDYLKGILGYKLTIGYSVEPTDGSGTERFGADVTVAVGTIAKEPLPAPKVLEATKSGVLDPVKTAAKGASVVIDEADLKYGDYIQLTWDGDAQNGDYQYGEEISFNGEGQPFTHQVPHPYVLANQDMNIRVTYLIERIAGGEQPSDVLLLSVQRAELPLPSISEATGPDRDQINPDDVPTEGANARIGVTAQLKDGDVVTLMPSGAAPIVRPILRGDEGRELVVRIPRTVIDSNNGGSFTLGFTIKRKAGGPIETSGFKNFDVRRVIGSGKLKVMGARHNSNAYRSSSVPCLIWALNAQTLQPMLAEWRYAGGVAWIAGTQFIDTESARVLEVRSTTDRVALNPVNVCGNGTVNNMVGDTAVVMLRDTRVSAGGAIGGRDLVSFGNPVYGGAVPPTYAILENLQNVFCSGGAFAVLTKDGTPLAFGETSNGGITLPADFKNFTTIAGNGGAFAGLTVTGNVRCWGFPWYGGNGVLSDIRRVFNGGVSFCAERTDGSITAWGQGVVANPVPGVNNVDRIICSHQAYAGITKTKRLFAFGVAGYGNVVPPDIVNRTDIQRLCCANSRAFVALTTAKTIVAWGDATYGGHLNNYPGIATQRFIDVASTWYAFAGITENYRVAAWGQAPAGVVPAHISALTNVIQVVGTSNAFAVLCADGRVFAWGNATLGGDTSAVAAQLVNVVAIYTSSHAFIALTSDKRVVVWGHPKAIAGATGFNGFVSHIDESGTVAGVGSNVSEEAAESK